MKQTAVEWYSDKLLEILEDNVNLFTKEQTLANHYALKQAKEMEERNRDFFSIKFTEWCLDLLLNNEEIQAKTTIELLNLFKQKQIRYDTIAKN